MFEWNVYYHNFNSNKFEIYNILKHGGFVEYAKKHRKKYKTKEEFAENLKRELMYYFWSKSEYEVVITKKDNKIIMTPWIGKKEEISLDVTDNEDFDWVGFYDWISYKKYARDGSIKIDIYDQVRYRWDEFVEYCWEIKNGKGRI